MANGVIGKVTAGGGTHLVTSTFYGTCATAAGTAAKIVKLADSTADAATLLTGMTLAVKFTNSNTVANPTLTVQRNSNTTNLIAAKSIMRYGTTAPGTTAATSWRAGAVVIFVYDGTNWVMVSTIDDNSTYTVPTAGTTATAVSTTANGGSATTWSKSDHVHNIALATGDNNGQVKIAGTNVSVKGLGSAAYTASTNYATSGHNHDSTYVNVSGDTMTGALTLSGAPTANLHAATKQYVDQSFAANDAMIFKGTIGSSGATVTALPNTHNIGWTYRVLTAGTYAGVKCEIGDLIICIADGTAANNAHWTVAQTNIDGAVIGPASATNGNIALFDGTTGKLIKNSSYSPSSFILSNTNGNTQNLYRPLQLNGLSDNTLDAKINDLRANRLAFLPADQIIIEKTTDGGSTWVDAGVTDAVKTSLFSETRPTVWIPTIDGKKNINCGLRITFTAMKYNVPAGTAETQKYNYWNSNYIVSTERYNQLKEMYFWVNANSDTISVKAERATGAASTTWVTIFENNSWGMTGWSGNDYIRFPQSVFGGGTNQTTNYWNYRLTFFTRGPGGSTTLSTSSTTSGQGICEIRGYGDTWWVAGNNYAASDHIYSHDYNKNVTFPANVTAAAFIGTINTTSPMVITNTKMPVSGGKVTSLAANSSRLYSDGLAISNPATANDVGWIRVTGTGESDTVMEIATGDDAGAGEKIVARQYNTSNAVAKEAQILGTNGITTFPVSVTVQGTTDATSSTAATLISSGGLAIAKKAWIGSGLGASSNNNTSSQLIISSNDTGAGGDVALELWRGTNASWQLSNESGDLHIRTNYTTTRQSTYSVDAVKIAYNTGTVTLKTALPVASGGTGTTTFTSGALLIGNGTSAIGTRTIKNITAKGDLGWTAAATDIYIPTVNTLAYWNGRYNSTSSNLEYCSKGAFGNAVTYGVDDATANGALGTGTGLTTERSVYYGLVTVNNASQTRATGIYAPTSAGTANQILVSAGGTSAPVWKATANGAAYATSANGALTFGTLPIAQGGTGATNKRTAGLIYDWTATIQGKKWSRLCYIPCSTSTTGTNFILNIRATRSSVVYNYTFIITTHHASKCHITALACSNYSLIKIRGLANSSGDCYVELYDEANNIASGTAQSVSCHLLILSKGTTEPTLYTAFTDGTTLPSNFTASTLELKADAGIQTTGKYYGVWNGTAIPVANGGTGATSAADARTNLGITPANIGAATSGHTHTTALASDTGTSTVTLTSGGKFKLTAGGTSVIFTMPTSTNNAGTITGVTGSDGLTGSGTSGSVTIKHAAPSTSPAKTTSAVYPITIDKYGHITAAGSAVTILTIGTGASNAAAGNHNHDSTYVNVSGDTMTGGLNTANNVWNKIGDDAQLGDINKAGHIGIQGLNGNTGIFFTTYNQTTKTTGGAITWDGSKFSITGTVSTNISGNANTATTATTATKLGTATVGSANRGIYLNAGTPTALTWYPNSVAVNSGNTNNYPWHRVATVNLGTSSWVDKDAILFIRSRYNGGKYGIIKISARANNATTNPKQSVDISAGWIIRYGFAVGDIRIAKKGLSGESAQVDVYVKCGSYMRAIAYFEEGSNNGWSLIASTEANDTTASDKKTSVEVWADITTSQGAITYDTVKDATDIGIVSRANSAETLQTARTINGTSFNGSENITTANWGTSRTLTIGSSGKSVNGSANVSWTLAEIGAAATSHTHNYINLYEARATTTTLNKTANYVGAGAMFHLVASSSTSATDNGKPPMGDANVLQMNWDNNGGYDAQLAISTGANRMEFRDRASQKNAWREVVTITPGTAAGSTTTPAYIDTTGVATAITLTGTTSLRNSLGLGTGNGALAVANGGTGATTAANARTNLGITPANIGAAASDHNHDTAYVKKTGDTMSGSLTVGTTSQSAAPTGSITVHDTRNYTWTPTSLDKGVNWYFTMSNSPVTSTWWSIMHINGWTGDYNAWELAGPSHNSDQRTTPLYVRSGRTTNGWGSWRKIYDTSNKPSITAHSYTPAGTNSAPAFTGTAATIVVNGGTGTATYTPAGTIAVNTAGSTVAADDITAWTTNTPTAVTKKTVITTATVSNEVLTLTSGDSVTVTAGTAASLSYTARTVKSGDASYKFTGTGTRLTASYTPAGSVAAPTFTGTAATLSHTVS